MKWLVINLTFSELVSLSRMLTATSTGLVSIAAIKARKYLLVTYKHKLCGFSIYYNIKSIKLYKIQRQNVAVFSLSCTCFVLGNLFDSP